jgi:hypothetical protein
MSVTVDGEVFESWEDEDRDVATMSILLASSDAPESLLTTTVRAAEDAMRVCDDDDDAYFSSFQPLPEGVGVSVSDGTNLRPIMSAFVRLLENGGVNGTVRLVTPESPFPLGSTVESGFVVGRVALEVETFPAERPFSWRLSAHTLESVLDVGLSWLTEGGGTIFGGGRAFPWSTEDVRQARSLAWITTRHLSDTPTSLVTKNGNRFRVFDIYPNGGHAAVAVGELTAFPASQLLAETCAALDALSPHAVYGLVRRGSELDFCVRQWNAGEWRLPAGAPPTKRDHRSYEQQGLIDAFPAQLVNSFDPRPLPADRWRTRDARRGHLIVSREAEQWITGTGRESLPAEARGDLGIQSTRS